MEPKPITYPTDRTTLLRCVRAFVEVLHERIAGNDGKPGCNLQLSPAITTDQIVEVLLAHDREMSQVDVTFNIDDDLMLAEIVRTLRELFESR